MRARQIALIALAGSAALSLSACGGKDKTAGNDVLVTDMGNVGMADGTVSDNMTPIDGATMGSGAPLANDVGPMDMGGGNSQ